NFRISVVATLPGDFNHDNKVDAADYVFWRKNQGTQTDYTVWRRNFGNALSSQSNAQPGDFNVDNHVDAADYVVLRKNNLGPTAYNTWRANFGNALAPAAGSDTSAATTLDEEKSVAGHASGAFELSDETLAPRSKSVDDEAARMLVFAGFGSST